MFKTSAWKSQRQGISILGMNWEYCMRDQRHYANLTSSSAIHLWFRKSFCAFLSFQDKKLTFI